MPQYLVRMSCEYSLPVEADSEEEALKIAEAIPESKWDKAWSGLEIEEGEW